MYFKYGTYQHPPNTVDLTMISQQRMHSPRNRITFNRWTLAVQGHFCVSGQSSIKAQLEEFEAAYRDDWQDVGLYHDDGTVSQHWLSNAASINGVRIMGRSYPSGEAEYASGRTFTITFQADYLDLDENNQMESEIWDFQESMNFFGGTGPNIELVRTYVGSPRIVTNSLYTVQRIVQQGSVTGVRGLPRIPYPRVDHGMVYHSDQSSVSRGSAEMRGVHKSLLYPARWRYVYSSAVNLDEQVFPYPDFPEIPYYLDINP